MLLHNDRAVLLSRYIIVVHYLTIFHSRNPGMAWAKVRSDKNSSCWVSALAKYPKSVV